jgi:hypothetical protein
MLTFWNHISFSIEKQIFHRTEAVSREPKLIPHKVSIASTRLLKSEKGQATVVIGKFRPITFYVAHQANF